MGDGSYWAMSTDYPLGNTNGVYIVEGQNDLFSWFSPKTLLLEAEVCGAGEDLKQRDLWIPSAAVRDGRDGGPGLQGLDGEDHKKGLFSGDLHFRKVSLACHAF